MSDSSVSASTNDLGWGVLPASIVAKRSRNPIRGFIDSMHTDPGHAKSHIPLSLGDPTVFGNFSPPSELLNLIRSSLESQKFNGYVHSAGSLDARRAVADFYNSAGLAMPKLSDKVCVFFPF